MEQKHNGTVGFWSVDAWLCGHGGECSVAIHSYASRDAALVAAQAEARARRVSLYQRDSAGKETLIAEPSRR